MPFTGRRGLYSSARIVYIQLCDITVPPGRARKRHTPADDELARSILRYGVLQPVSVRRIGGGYELISGTRRYFAARMAGLSDIPCIILNVDTPDGEIIALTENLQRRDLDYVEEAEELYRLVHLHNLSQEDAARRIGRSQSSVANKLRLLRLPRRLLYAARDNGVTERHLRELLRLKDVSRISGALAVVIKRSLTVAETAKYVDGLLFPRQEPKIAIASPDMFINTIERAAELMRKSGFSVEVKSTDAPSGTSVNILISRPAPL